ncbi:MAG: hypothetical protein II329_01910 [Clostridia bacterium]|nr:hypothetical protein [Clostridia bacterium]
MDSNEFNNTFDTQQTYESGQTPAPDKGAIFAEKIRAIFASKAFLTATIAFTVMAGASLILGTLDVFAILFTVGMWLAYTSASKSGFPLKDMKFLSGVVKAYYIVSIIGIVCLVISGIILIATGPSVMKAEGEVREMIDVIDQNFAFNWSSVAVEEGVTISSLGGFLLYVSTKLEMSVATFIGIFMVVLGVILIVSAVISILINEFFIHKLGKQMKKTVAALELGTDTELKLGGIKAWFIVIGVFSALSAVSVFTTFDILLFASEGASAVACFALAEALKEKDTAPASVQPML